MGGMSTLATLAFIGAAAAAGGYLATRDTVAKGSVMAADLMSKLNNKDITSLECDPEIPLGPNGAKFQCTVHAKDGSTALIEYTMSRAGSLAAKLLDGTGPTEPRVPASSDPWGN
jgi:hypothetical protein